MDIQTRQWMEEQQRKSWNNICECGHPQFVHLILKDVLLPDEQQSVCFECHKYKPSNKEHKFEKSFDTVVKEMRDENEILRTSK